MILVIAGFFRILNIAMGHRQSPLGCKTTPELNPRLYFISLLSSVLFHERLVCSDDNNDDGKNKVLLVIHVALADKVQRLTFFFFGC